MSHATPIGFSRNESKTAIELLVKFGPGNKYEFNDTPLYFREPLNTTRTLLGL